MNRQSARGALAALFILSSIGLTACGNSSTALSSEASESSPDASVSTIDVTTAPVSIPATTTTLQTKAVTTSTTALPASGVTSNGCTNLSLKAATRSALVAKFGHGITFFDDGFAYYGKCGSTYYAVFNVLAPSDVSPSNVDYFRQNFADSYTVSTSTDATNWTVIGKTSQLGSGDVCQPTKGNASSNPVAAALTKLWGNCQAFGKAVAAQDHDN